MSTQDRVTLAARRAAKTTRHRTRTPAGSPVRVGVVEAYIPTQDPTTDRVLTVAGLPGLGGDPVDIPEQMWAEPFRVQATSLGRALVGRRVLIHAIETPAGTQFVVASTIGRSG